MNDLTIRWNGIRKNDTKIYRNTRWVLLLLPKGNLFRSSHAEYILENITIKLKLLPFSSLMWQGYLKSATIEGKDRLILHGWWWPGYKRNHDIYAVMTEYSWCNSRKVNAQRFITVGNETLTCTFAFFLTNLEKNVMMLNFIHVSNQAQTGCVPCRQDILIMCIGLSVAICITFIAVIGSVVYTICIFMMYCHIRLNIDDCNQGSHSLC